MKVSWIGGCRYRILKDEWDEPFGRTSKDIYGRRDRISNGRKGRISWSQSLACSGG